MADSNGNWEHQVIEKLALAAVTEQRRARRWGIFFKLLTFAYLTFLLIVLFDWRGDSRGLGGTKHTALVDITGVIESRGEASADRVNSALQSAFKDRNTQGVVLRINSPGGSPVQSGLIYDEIRRLRSLYPSMPMYAVIEDIGASGAYYIAAAADRIYVDKASIVGSIGVLMDGWGFTGTMEKLGVERRVLTAGENKDFMDPFQPVDLEQRKHAQALLNEVHRQFIDVVKKGRGNRLKDAPELFSGLVWTGERSVELGLSDGLGSLDWVAREVIKAEDIVDYTQKPNVAERFAKRFGATVADAVTRVVLQRDFNLR
ncbi:MAG: peptidase S49 [Betaproteobacteria bacterium RIFCSPLOWO2_02_FULL_65_24]|nr:MAG: peptidase S49 [Betaproteobacteria bacterium RIFCSPLOWO2_02_FULL_65_24]